jgi:hypothetical protein
VSLSQHQLVEDLHEVPMIRFLVSAASMAAHCDLFDYFVYFNLFDYFVYVNLFDYFVYVQLFDYFLYILFFVYACYIHYIALTED